MDVWEVFQQKGHHDPFVHVGSVLAPDPQMAMAYAKECFFRRREGRNLWIARRADIHTLDDPSTLDQVIDKSYRYPEAYRGVVTKRQKARERALAITGGVSAPRAETKTDGDEY